MAFEVFDRGHHVNPRETVPFVTISKDTWIVFSKPCTEFLAGKPCVICLIDKENKKVAVRKCENDENGYRIQRHPCGTQARISVRNFLKVIGSKNRARIPATITGDLIVFSVEE